MSNSRPVDFIERYTKHANGDYEWCDNLGEIVRCKDCEHAIEGEKVIIPGIKSMCCKFGWQFVEEDDFCSKGKRKEEVVDEWA